VESEPVADESICVTDATSKLPVVASTDKAIVTSAVPVVASSTGYVLPVVTEIEESMPGRVDEGFVSVAASNTGIDVGPSDPTTEFWESPDV
jgi:hypothetical protein